MTEVACAEIWHLAEAQQESFVDPVKDENVQNGDERCQREQWRYEQSDQQYLAVLGQPFFKQEVEALEDLVHVFLMVLVFELLSFEVLSDEVSVNELLQVSWIYD